MGLRLFVAALALLRFALLGRAKISHFLVHSHLVAGLIQPLQLLPLEAPKPSPPIAFE